MNKMKKGYCSNCYTVLTKDNAYKRKGGYWCTYCRDCDAKRLYEWSWGKKPISVIEKEADRLRQKLKSLSTILRNKQRMK